MLTVLSQPITNSRIALGWNVCHGGHVSVLAHLFLGSAKHVSDAGVLDIHSHHIPRRTSKLLASGDGISVPMSFAAQQLGQSLSGSAQRVDLLVEIVHGLDELLCL